MNRQPGNVEIPRGLADRILSSLKPVTQRKRAIQACAGLKDLLAQSGAGTGSVSIGWDEAGQLLRHLAFTTGVHDPVSWGAISTRSARSRICCTTPSKSLQDSRCV